MSRPNKAKPAVVVVVLLLSLAAACSRSAPPAQTQGTAATATGTARPSLTFTQTPAASCQPPAQHEQPAFDTSYEGYFAGVVALTEYYTLLSSGLPEEAYQLLSADAQKTSPLSQYVDIQKRNFQAVQIVTAEPLRAWQQQQGITSTTTDLENRITFLVQIKLAANTNTPGSAQNENLQTFYPTLHAGADEYAAPASRCGPGCKQGLVKRATNTTRPSHSGPAGALVE